MIILYSWSYGYHFVLEEKVFVFNLNDVLKISGIQ